MSVLAGRAGRVF